jgi:hypothetical protein
MALNDLGEEIYAKPVTLPKFKLADIDVVAEAREAAAIVAERRVIRTGLDAWRLIHKAESFENWKLIGAALAIGKQHALRATGANDTSSRHYIKWFSRWLVENGFGVMKPQTRSWAIALHENAAAITTWRDSLPAGRGRRRPLNPQSCVKGWQRSLANGNGRCSQDWKREAVAAWRRFCFCVQALPPGDQAQMWAMASQARIADVIAA